MQLFDFMDTDYFNIGLEIVFVILISYDVKKYFQTRQRKYITNIVLTLGFAIWTLYPYYTSYVGWEDEQKRVMISHCLETDNSNLCKCVDEATFKSYTHDEYVLLDTNSTEYKEWLDETKEECLDESWF